MTPRTLAVVALAVLIPGFPASTFADLQEKRHGLEVGISWLSGNRSSELSSSVQPGITSTFDGANLMPGFSYYYRTRKDLAVVVSVFNLSNKIASTVASGRMENDLATVTSVLAGVRKYYGNSELRPYWDIRVGPYIGNAIRSRAGDLIASDFVMTAAPGGRVCGGIELPLGSHFGIDLGAGLDLMMDFGKPVANRKNYSGFEVGLGLSWWFGRMESKRSADN